MINYVTSISKLLEKIGEEHVTKLLSDFSCRSDCKSASYEVEHFARHKAIEFYRQKLAVTYLVFNESFKLSAIFSLAHKAIELPISELNSKQKRKAQRFSQLDSSHGTYKISAFLIAQLGKNYSIENGQTIYGFELMHYIIDFLSDLQDMIGGGLIYLEVEEQNTQAIRLYKTCGFKIFEKRVSKTEDNSYLLMFKMF